MVDERGSIGWQSLSEGSAAKQLEPDLRATPQPPTNEGARVQALKEYYVLGEALAELKDLTRVAANTCATPFAAISIVGSERVWYKAAIGRPIDECARWDSPCSWTILGAEPMVVSDVREDSRFREGALAKASPGVRFYAGTPLRTPEGHSLGALCVMDWRPRQFSKTESEALRALGRAVMAQLALRRDNRELERAIVQQGRALDSLAASEERYRLVVQSSNDGVWDWNLEDNEIHFCNRWKSMLGFEDADIGSSVEEWLKRVHPDDAERVQTELVAHLLGQTPHFQSEHRVMRRDRSYRWMLSRGLAIWDSNRAIYRMAGSVTDITEQKDAEERLLRTAYHDVLTGLPNRALFKGRLEQALERAKRCDGYAFAVLFLDLDRFKVVNDSLGHPIGDQLLVAAARRLQAALRPGDMLSRLGGDEFAIILEGLREVGDATDAAERIQKELMTPFNLSGYEVFASASIGIAYSQSLDDQPDDYLRHADTAMYRAKDKGRSRYELFDKGMHANAVALLELETDLRRALARGEFKVYYQPIISLDDWSIKGFEALLRWEHPQRGFIDPMQFIPVAEETGSIMQIGLWVLRQACEQLREWQNRFPSQPPLTMSVNLSGKQFLQQLTKLIEQILLDTRIAPGSLKIEITESVIIENIELATSMLKDLRALGIRISLDDFGTGYSSLSHLHQFPIDTIKIDRSFVTAMHLPKNAEIVRTILSLAANLGMEVIAEGVETKEQAIQLSALDCEYVQGYLLSKPLDAGQIEQLIEEVYQAQRAQGASPVSNFEGVDFDKSLSIFGNSAQQKERAADPPEAHHRAAGTPAENPSVTAPWSGADSQTREMPAPRSAAQRRERRASPAQGAAAQNHRRAERIKMVLPTKVTGHDADGRWTETTHTVDVSRTGISINLERPTRRGTVLHVTLPLPVKLRRAGGDEPTYKAYAVVRRVQAAREGGCFIGLEFLGEQRPEGIEQRVAKSQARGRPGAEDRRREPRLKESHSVLIEYLDSRLQTIVRAPAQSENVSRRGIRVRLIERAPTFEALRIVAYELGVNDLATVRDRYVGSDGFERMCLELIEKNS